MKSITNILFLKELTLISNSKSKTCVSLQTVMSFEEKSKQTLDFIWNAVSKYQNTYPGEEEEGKAIDIRSVSYVYRNIWSKNCLKKIYVYLRET